MNKVKNIIRFIMDSNRGSFSEYIRKAYQIRFNFVFDFNNALEDTDTSAYRIQITHQNIEQVYGVFADDVLRDKLDKKDVVYVLKKILTGDPDTFIFERLNGMVFKVLDPIKKTLESESPSYTQRDFRIDVYNAMRFIISFVDKNSDTQEKKRLCKLCDSLLKEIHKEVTVDVTDKDSHHDVISRNRYKLGF